MQFPCVVTIRAEVDRYLCTAMSKLVTRWKSPIPVNLFSLDLRATKHVFLAGGIGITPFMAMIAQLERSNGHWELHYSVRTPSLGTYVDQLTAKYPNKVKVYYDDQSQAIDLDKLLDGQPLGTNVYVCGPKGMINWVHKSAAAAGMA